MEMISFRFKRQNGENTPAFQRRVLRILNEHRVILPDNMEEILFAAIDDNQHDLTVLAYGGPGRATATIHRRDACWVN
jgi:hypothetical protein